MIYIIYTVLLTIFFLISYFYYLSIINHNTNMKKDGWTKFDEDSPIKELPKKTNWYAYLSLLMVGMFVLFIVSRILLCGFSEKEYKNLEVPITNHIQSDGYKYLLYIGDKLEYIPITSVDIIVNNNISTPYIEGYYSRTIKNVVPYSKLFFLNRTEKKIGEWEEKSCGCGGKYKLIVDKKYEIKNIN